MDPPTLAPLYFVDLDTKTATALDPTTVTVAQDKAAYPGCPGPADFADLESLGIDYQVVNGRNILSVVSHGGGFSIQLFEMAVDGAAAHPELDRLRDATGRTLLARRDRYPGPANGAPVTAASRRECARRAGNCRREATKSGAKRDPNAPSNLARRSDNVGQVADRRTDCARRDGRRHRSPVAGDDLRITSYRSDRIARLAYPS